MDSATREALGLPEVVHMPPDMSVPLIVPGGVVDEWTKQDAAGSAEAAYCLGKLASQTGDVGRARTYLERGAERGSPEAAYAIAVLSLFRGEKDEEVRRLVEAADHAGSPSGTMLLHGIELHAGNAQSAEAAAKRALERAAIGDRGGSADDALVIAQLAPSREARRAAARRAYERGSGLGAMFEGVFLQDEGEPDRAMEAYLYAVRRGEIRAAVPLGDLLANAGRWREARRVWSQAGQIAASAGNEPLFAATQERLRPPIGEVIRRHKVVSTLYVAGLLALVASGHWRWAVVVALGTLVVTLFRYRPVHGARFTPVGAEPEGTQSLSFGGVTMTSRLTDDITPFEAQASPVRATKLDVNATVAGYAVYAGFTAVVGIWAAGRLGFRELLDWFALASAVVIVIQIVQALPRAMAPADERSESDPGNVIEGSVSISPLRFSKVGIQFAIGNPRISSLVEATRAARPPMQPLWAKRLGAGLRAMAALAGAVVLALPALAPDAALSFTTVVNAAESVVVVWLLVVCTLRVLYAITHREPGWMTAAILYGVLGLCIGGLGVLLSVWQIPDL